MQSVHKNYLTDTHILSLGSMHAFLCYASWPRVDKPTWRLSSQAHRWCHSCCTGSMWQNLSSPWHGLPLDCPSPSQLLMLYILYDETRVDPSLPHWIQLVAKSHGGLWWANGQTNPSLRNGACSSKWSTIFASLSGLKVPSSNTDNCIIIYMCFLYNNIIVGDMIIIYACGRLI